MPSDGLQHRYYAVHPPMSFDHFSLLVGDCLHNLRSSLDHLAWQLVRCDGATPSRRTAFPTEKAEGAIIEPRVSSVVMERIGQLFSGDSLWPDFASQVKDLHELDIWDKHRLLVVVSAVADIAHMRHTADHEEWLERPPRVRFADRDVVHGAHVLTVIYESPVHGDGPDIKPIAQLRIGPGPRGAGRPVAAFLGELLQMVQYVTALFKDQFTQT